jgi:hypothetical protein
MAVCTHTRVPVQLIVVRAAAIEFSINPTIRTVKSAQ